MLSTLLTFVTVSAIWVFFRASSLNDAFKVLGAMFGLGGYNYEIYKEMRGIFKDEFILGGTNSFLVLLVLAFIITLSFLNLIYIASNHSISG